VDILDWLKERNIEVKHPDVIHQAFMHTSYTNEHRGDHDNERLDSWAMRCCSYGAAIISTRWSRRFPKAK